MTISEFKAACFEVLRRVLKTGRPVRITRFGKPVADIRPSAPAVKRRRDWLGGMRETLKMRGDLVTPTSNLVEWEAMR